jgi:hypothetical protein
MIDEAGRAIDAGAAALERALSYPEPDFDLRGYAVRNLGWLHVGWGRDVLRIGVRPLAVTRAAFERAATLMIAAPRGTRFVFEHCAEAAATDVLVNLNDALARLEDLTSFAGEASSRGVFFAEELSLGRLRHPKRRVLCALIRLWKRERGRIADGMLPPFAEPAAAERTVVARLAPEGGVIAYAGSGLAVFGPGWPEAAVGRPIADLPDPEFGARAAAIYRRVSADARPRLELVDAIIRPPGAMVQRCRFERLVLPWRGAAGTLYVSSTSVLRTRFHFA